jgi:hypothetical protein
MISFALGCGRMVADLEITTHSRMRTLPSGESPLRTVMIVPIRREFQRAIYLNHPGYADAHHWHAINFPFISLKCV